MYKFTYGVVSTLQLTCPLLCVRTAQLSVTVRRNTLHQLVLPVLLSPVSGGTIMHTYETRHQIHTHMCICLCVIHTSVFTGACVTRDESMHALVQINFTWPPRNRLHFVHIFATCYRCNGCTDCKNTNIPV